MHAQIATAEPPPGLTLIADFISADDERALVAQVDAGAWSQELRRRVRHFGYRYDYRARRLTAYSRLGPLPDWLAPLAHRLAAAAPFERVPDQVIANEYVPGQGISAHIDCAPCFGPVIASLSLLSPCEMIFRKPGTTTTFSLVLTPRSLLILTDAARSQWTHEIPARKSDVVEGVKCVRGRRVSLTFRTVSA